MTNGVARTGASIALALALIGCGSPPPPSPTPVPATPAPTPTPNPHLTSPASVDDVLAQLGRGGLRIVPNNASHDARGEPIKTVNATYQGWPLSVSAFSNAKLLHEKGAFLAGKQPPNGRPAFRIAGLNILVEYGPRIHKGDDAPPERYRTAVAQLVAALDPVLGPLEVSAVTPVTVPAAPSGTAPSTAPGRRPSPATSARAPSATPGK